MPILDVRPGVLDVRYRPGNLVAITLTWPADALDGRSFVSFLGDDELEVDVTGDVMTVTASAEITEEHTTAAAWVLTEDTLDVLITGRWSPSLRGTVDPSVDAVVVVGDPEVTVEVAVIPRGPVDSVNGRTGTVIGLAEQSALTAEADTRAAADAALDVRVTAVEADDAGDDAAIAAVAANLASEAGTRAAADSALDVRLTAVEADDAGDDAALAAEAATRAAADSALTTALAAKSPFVSTFEIQAISPEVSHTDFATFTTTAGIEGSGRRGGAVGAVNAQVVMKLPAPLLAGTWKFVLGHRINTNIGIYTIEQSVDGSSWSAIGTIDGYAASPSVGRTELAGVTVAAGTQFVRMGMASKNAASSAYFGLWGALYGLRTGA